MRVRVRVSQGCRRFAKGDTLQIDIEPVDDAPELEAPELLEVESRVSLRGIAVHDVDTMNEAYKMTLFACFWDPPSG